MSQNTTYSKDGCGAGSDNCELGKRNLYFHRKEVTSEVMALEQHYFIDRRRLINRSVHGWGVVAGFQIHGPTADASSSLLEPTTIGAGFALDRLGRELVLCSQATLEESNTFLADATSHSGPRPLRQATPGRYVLRTHYAERDVDDVVVTDCGCSKTEKNFLCESVVFSLTPLGECDKCPCAEGECERECRCGSDACCVAGRGPHACLCEWVSNTKIDCFAKPLCKWKGFRIDLRDPVDLACITLGPTDDPCNPIAITNIDDACSPRRLVKNNDLLYDLARGCDLTFIESISWADWHRNPKPMPWDTFMGFIGTGSPPIATNLKVRFSGPVRVDTVTPDAFALRFVFRHEDTGWRARRVVRIPRINTSPREEGDPLGSTREAQITVTQGWHNEVMNGPSQFLREGATVNLEIFGDYILDCHGQPIDANARGFALATGHPKRAGNGTPGGTFLSVFRIERCPQRHDDSDEATTST